MTQSLNSSNHEHDTRGNHASAEAIVGSNVTAADKQQHLQSSIQLEPTKRSKTWGERLFDITTYGGFALVGNEVTATAIVKQKDKSNFIGKAYRTCDRFFRGLGNEGELPYFHERFTKISFAILGGFVMVPFVKMLEDNKGRLVRYADKILYGDKAKTDQEIVKKHEEMDNAPNQTWGSLGKGRVLTVAAAYAVDSTVNWNDGLSARLLKGTRFEKHASLEHMSDIAANRVYKHLTSIRNNTPKAPPIQKESLELLFGLGTLSATLTVLFYASSKIFAKKHEEKLERRSQGLPSTVGNTLRDDVANEATTATAPTNANEAPSAKVTGITREATLSQAQTELAASH